MTNTQNKEEDDVEVKVDENRGVKTKVRNLSENNRDCLINIELLWHAVGRLMLGDTQRFLRNVGNNLKLEFRVLRSRQRFCESL